MDLQGRLSSWPVSVSEFWFNNAPELIPAKFGSRSQIKKQQQTKNQNRNKALLKRTTQKLNSAAYLSCLLSHISVSTCILVPPRILVTQRCYCSTRYSYVAAQWSVGWVVGGLMLDWSSFICCQVWHPANYALRCRDDVIGEVMWRVQDVNTNWSLRFVRVYHIDRRTNRTTWLLDTPGRSCFSNIYGIYLTSLSNTH